MDQRLTIVPGTSSEDGACNFCNRHGVDTATMKVPQHDVYTVFRDGGNGIAARFCRRCLGDLMIAIPMVLRSTLSGKR